MSDSPASQSFFPFDDFIKDCLAIFDSQKCVSTQQKLKIVTTFHDACGIVDIAWLKDGKDKKIKINEIMKCWLKILCVIVYMMMDDGYLKLLLSSSL